MKYKSIIVILLATLLTTACGNDTVSVVFPSNGGSDSTLIQLDASIDNNGSSSSRAVNTTNSFPIGSTIGLWFTIHDSQTEPYNPRKTNMRAVWTELTDYYKNRYNLTDNFWLFNHDGDNRMTFTTLFLATNSIDNGDGTTTAQTMDAFAYAPHYQGLTDLTQVPFTITQGAFDSQEDYMYATQNSSSSDNKDMSVTGSELPLTLTFKHVMAAIRVKITNKNTDTKNSSVSVVTSLKIIRKKDDGSTHLYTSGTYNAITGAVSVDNDSDVDTLKWTLSDGDSEASQESATIDTQTPADINVLLVPTDSYSEGDYTLAFTIDTKGMTVENGTTKGKTVEYQYSLPASLFTETDNSCKLQGGSRYTLEFTYDNYIHFYKAYADTTWKDDKDDLLNRRY